VASAERRLAVVLFNLGGPDAPAAVRPFLFNLFNDPAIIGLPDPLRRVLARLISTLRASSARKNYALMGGGSPLLPQTRAQAEALQAVLAGRADGAEVKVFVAMRYWTPFVQDTAREVAAWAPDEVVLLPLYPQFSTTTTASSLKAWREAYRGPGEVRAVCCYPAETGLVEAHARRIEAAWAEAGKPEGLRLLFSAHGLPQSCVDAGDPYAWQVERTCRAVAERLGAGWEDWTLCYQSRVGPMKWLGPAIGEAIAEAGRQGKGVLVTPIAFVSEHIETLVELDRDYAEAAEKAGCPVYLRAAALGCEPAFIEGLARTALAALGREGTAPQGEACAGGWGQCPLRAEQGRTAA